MPLPVFDTQDQIPEVFRSEYEERDENGTKKWHPKESDDTTGLKSALDTERTKREAAEKLAKRAADELKKRETQEKADKAGITDEQLQALRADVRKDLESEYASFKTDAEKFAAENRTLKLDHQVKGLFAKAGFLGEKLEDLWALRGKDFDLTDDGKPMVKEKPGTTPERYVKDVLLAAYPEWVQGTQGSGGGAKGITRGGAPATAMSGADVLANPSQALQAARSEGKTE